MSDHNRFNELQRTIKGISARVLSIELKELELSGLVKRMVQTDKKPVIVEYVPTKYGLTRKDLIATLADWGRKHSGKIILS